jgi:hypothetical protein
MVNSPKVPAENLQKVAGHVRAVVQESYIATSVVYPDPNWIRSRRTKITHKNRKKITNLIFCSAGFSLLRAKITHKNRTKINKFNFL